MILFFASSKNIDTMSIYALSSMCKLFHVSSIIDSVYVTLYFCSIIPFLGLIVKPYQKNDPIGSIYTGTKSFCFDSMTENFASSFIFFASSPFVHTNTLLAERLQKSSETRLHVFQRK